METFIVTKVSGKYFSPFSHFTHGQEITFAANLSIMKQPQPPKQGNFRKLFRFFIQGLLILAPIAITVWAVVAAFTFVDNLLPKLIYNLFPSWAPVDAQGNLRKITGLGFVVVIGFVIFVGWISSNFLMGSLIHFFDQWLERTPGIKFIYTSIKDFFEAFAGDKRKFTKAVLANLFAEEVWVVGFMTDEEMKKFDMGVEMVGVYVPQAYNFAGQLYILPRNKVRHIENISAGDAMKYTVTGGVVETETDEEKAEEKRGFSHPS